mgnify:CR=1 FL=1
MSLTLEQAPRALVEDPGEQWAPGLQKARAYEVMLLDIIIGVLRPGARLDEAALAARYDFGLASIRDALGRLALEGLVQRRPRVGTSVAPLDLIEIRQAFEARCLVEPHCAALAARRASADEVKAMLTAFDGADEAHRRRDFRALVAMDQAFHRAVAAGSHNPALIRIVRLLHHKAARYWIHTLSVNPPAAEPKQENPHLAVARAIAARDPVTAARAMHAALAIFPAEVGRAAASTPTALRGPSAL